VHKIIAQRTESLNWTAWELMFADCAEFPFGTRDAKFPRGFAALAARFFAID